MVCNVIKLCVWGVTAFVRVRPDPTCILQRFYGIGNPKKNPMRTWGKTPRQMFYLVTTNVYRDTTISRLLTALMDLTLQLFASVNCTSN